MTEPFKTDYYFVFADEAEMTTAMSAFYQQDTQPALDENGDPTYDVNGDPILEPAGDPYMVKDSHHHAIDIVGTIYEPTGNPVPGWHVNLRIRGDYMRTEAETIDTQYGVEPVTPHRTWL